MKIQYASDLHLEFPQNWNFLKNNPLHPKGDVLLLAGDIVPFVAMAKYDDFFDYLSAHFKLVYWIPGNHEYYRSDISERCGCLNEQIRSNVFLVNNISIVLDDVKFIYSTLWSKISSDKQWVIEQSLNDFHVVKYKGKPFSVAQYNQFHKESIEFIQQELADDKSKKIVVVTHHAPTFMNYPAKYKSSELNEAFSTELFDLIEKNGPDYWIYGHIHANTPAFTIGKTQLLTNQTGYVHDGENQDFNPYAMFEV